MAVCHTAGWRRSSEDSHFVQILPTVLHHIISLMPVNVHSLAVADGLESKVVNPRTAVRSDILHGKCCGSCAEGRSSHSPTDRRTGWSYSASLGECILPYPLGCFVIQFFVAVKSHSLVLVLLPLRQSSLVVIELLSQFTNCLVAVTDD